MPVFRSHQEISVFRSHQEISVFRSKTVCGSCIIFVLKEIMTFHAFCWAIKTRRNRKWKIPYSVLERWTLCSSSYKNSKLKVKLWRVEVCERKTTESNPTDKLTLQWDKSLRFWRRIWLSFFYHIIWCTVWISAYLTELFLSHYLVHCVDFCLFYWAFSITLFGALCGFLPISLSFFHGKCIAQVVSLLLLEGFRIFDINGNAPSIGPIFFLDLYVRRSSNVE